MSNNSNLAEFLNILDTENNTKLKVDVSSKKTVSVSPLNFKQQKQLITSGLNGLVGVMQFIKNLNEIIIENSNESKLKIYDRIPIILALRKNLFDKSIEVDDKSIDINDLIKNFKPFTGEESLALQGNGYTLNLKIPNLEEENKFISGCIDEIKKNNIEDIGNNASIIISHEIPKFIESVTFGEEKIDMYSLSSIERTKIINSLPATMTNKITDFILKIREYDENLLTIDGVTVEIDHTFFE
jgi:hypothetical protein